MTLKLVSLAALALIFAAATWLPVGMSLPESAAGLTAGAVLILAGRLIRYRTRGT